MHNLKMLLGLVVTFPWLGTAQAQKENAAQADLKTLQGVWQVTKWIDSEGTLAPADEVKGTTFEFKDDRVIKRSDGRAREPLKVVLNPSKKPKWIEFDVGIDTGVELKGIYKLDGDELTICIISGSTSGQAAERPTAFKANKQKHHTLFVMKKTKK